MLAEKVLFLEKWEEHFKKAFVTPSKTLRQAIVSTIAVENVVN